MSISPVLRGGLAVLAAAGIGAGGYFVLKDTELFNFGSNNDVRPERENYYADHKLALSKIFYYQKELADDLGYSVSANELTKARFFKKPEKTTFLAINTDTEKLFIHMGDQRFGTKERGGEPQTALYSLDAEAGTLTITTNEILVGQEEVDEGDSRQTDEKATASTRTIQYTFDPKEVDEKQLEELTEQFSAATRIKDLGIQELKNKQLEIAGITLTRNEKYTYDNSDDVDLNNFDLADFEVPASDKTTETTEEPK